MSTAPDGGPDKRTADITRQLVDLAADVRKARGETAKLRTITVDLASAISEWGPQLVDTQRDVAEMRGAVDQLVTEKAEDANAPVDWFNLAADDAEREWPKLGEWVHDVLGGWYMVTRGQLPDCWALHRPAFLQVAWLRSSHIEAYLDRSHPAQAAEWNTRWLDAALARIKDYIPDSQCRAVPGGRGEHLLDQLEAQQQEGRNQGRTQADLDRARAQAANLHQQVGQPAGGKYVNPYAQGGPAAPEAPERPGQAAAGREMIRWEYWGSYFDQAMRQDIAWRRDREAQRAAAAGNQDTDDDPAQQPVPAAP